MVEFLQKFQQFEEDNLNKILIDYEPEKYRTDIYPFNSTTYLNYLGKTSLGKFCTEPLSARI